MAVTNPTRILAACCFICLAGSAAAQSAPPSGTPAASQQASNALTPNVPSGGKAPDALVLYFASNSAAIRPQDRPLLDQASRLYRDGHPIIMTLTGDTDGVGSAAANLLISQQRTQAVLQGLVQRGIPADRFQLVAKGKTEQPVPVADGVAEPADRRVEIHWR